MHKERELPTRVYPRRQRPGLVYGVSPAAGAAEAGAAAGAADAAGSSRAWFRKIKKGDINHECSIRTDGKNRYHSGCCIK